MTSTVPGQIVVFVKNKHALDLYRHGAVQLGDGVAVTLTNLSAAERAAALRQDMMLCGVSRW